MTNKKYHTVGTGPKLNRKIKETDAILKSPNTHLYLTGHFTGLVQTLQ